MKKTVLLMCFFFCAGLQAQSKKLKDLVQELTDKTKSSISIDGNNVFYIYFTYDIYGFTQTSSSDADGTTYTFENGSTTLTVRWEDLEEVGLTDKGRVGVKVDSESINGHFITPNNGVEPQEIVDIIKKIYRKTTGYELKQLMFKDLELEQADQVIENSIYSNHLEILGRSSGIVTGTPDYSANEHPYEISDLRLMMSFGKHFRFDMGILGYSWIDLPAYNKYNSAGDLVGTDTFAFGSSFWTPSLGFSYVFYPKPALGDYVILEFPLSVSFAPLLFGSNSDFDADVESGDTLFEDYFAFSYVGQASLGATLYFSETFGISIKGGVYYFGVNATSNSVMSTDSSGITEEYTVAFDEQENNIKPYLEFSLKFRWE